MCKSNWIMLAGCSITLLLFGCAEGPLWQAGNYSPWAREKWDAEEQIADTYFERKRDLNQLVDSALNSSAQQQAQAANQLGELVQREPVLLVRLHAVQLLGKLSCSESVDALKLASKDPDSRIRIAATRSLMNQPATMALPLLQEILGSDTDVDVRLVATKALGETNELAATSALELALTDTNPAVQLRATEALQKITGEKIGADVAGWQSFLKTANRQATAGQEGNDRLIR